MEFTRVDAVGYARAYSPDNRIQPVEDQKDSQQELINSLEKEIDQDYEGILPAIQTNKAADYPASIVKDNKNDPNEAFVMPALGPKQSLDLRELKRMGEIKCQTCSSRKYQDGSDDSGVSYQAPTHISPEQSASAVRSHEQEHVVRERAQAKQDGRQIVRQSVQIFTSCCPECGKVYVSGGKTTTATRDKPEPIEFEAGSQFKPQQAPRVMPKYEPPEMPEPAAVGE